MNTKIKRIFGITMVTILLLGLTGSITISRGSQVVLANHPQPGIWDFVNQKNQPKSVLILTMEQIHWQAIVDVCLIPPDLTGHYHLHNNCNTCCCLGSNVQQEKAHRSGPTGCNADCLSFMRTKVYCGSNIPIHPVSLLRNIRKVEINTEPREHLWIPLG